MGGPTNFSCFPPHHCPFYTSKATLRSDSHTTALDPLEWEYKPQPILFRADLLLQGVTKPLSIQQVSYREQPWESDSLLPLLARTECHPWSKSGGCNVLDYRSRSAWRPHHREMSHSSLGSPCVCGDIGSGFVLKSWGWEGVERRSTNTARARKVNLLSHVFPCCSPGST